MPVCFGRTDSTCLEPDRASMLNFEDYGTLGNCQAAEYGCTISGFIYESQFWPWYNLTGGMVCNV